MNIQKLFAVVTLAAQSSLNPNLFALSAQTSIIAIKLSNTTVLVGDKAMLCVGALGEAPFMRERFFNGKRVAASATGEQRQVSQVASGMGGDLGSAVSVFLYNPCRIGRNQNDDLFMADSGVCYAIDDFVIPGTIHPSAKTRARSRKSFQYNLTFALRFSIALRLSGMIAAKLDGAQLISLLNAGFARAPPRSSLPLLLRFGDALDHALYSPSRRFASLGNYPRVSSSLFAVILKTKHSLPITAAIEGVKK